MQFIIFFIKMSWSRGIYGVRKIKQKISPAGLTLFKIFYFNNIGYNTGVHNNIFHVSNNLITGCAEILFM